MICASGRRWLKMRCSNNIVSSVSYVDSHWSQSSTSVLCEKGRPNYYEALNTQASRHTRVIRDEVEGAGLSLRRPGFDHTVVGVGFIVDEVAQGQVFSKCLYFSALLSFQHSCTLSFIYHRRYMISDSGFLLAYHQFTLVPELFDHSSRRCYLFSLYFTVRTS